MISLALDVRNERLNAISRKIDSGGKAGTLCIYSGPRPYAGGSPTTKLAEHVLSHPCAADAEDGVLVFDPISDCKSALAGGKAGWARITTSTGAFVADCSVGVGEGDIQVKTLDIYQGMKVEVKRAAIWEGNR